MFFLVHNNNHNNSNTYNLYLKPITSRDRHNNVEASKNMNSTFDSTEDTVYLTSRYHVHLHKNLGMLYVQRETSIIMSVSAQSTEPILLFEK